MKIYCCGCLDDVYPRLTSGDKIYPNRPDLVKIPFWQCPTCLNYVGCHHKTKNPTKPLGNIAPRKLREARQAIHFMLDPIWQSGEIERSDVYRILASRLGVVRFHVGDINSIEESIVVRRVIGEIIKDLTQ